MEPERSYALTMPLRILTANLYTGRVKPASFAALLHDAAPDVVAVQELAPSQAEVLGNWGVCRLLDPDDETTGMGLAVQVPAQLDRLGFPYRNPVRARFDGVAWGLRDVEVIGAHIANPISRPFAVSRLRRREEAAALEAVLTEPRSTRVLVGDFNSSPAWPLYRRIAALSVDGPAAAGTAVRTWGYFPRSPALLRIDHAFIQGARCVSSRTVKLDGGDHRALVVDVEPLPVESAGS